MPPGPARKPVLLVLGLAACEVTGADPESAYAFRPAGGGTWTASNETMAMDLRFDDSGVHVVTEGVEVQIELSAAAATPRLRDCESTPTNPCLPRLEARRGLVTEWWQNDAGGLEHGFDVSGPGSSNLVLDLSVTGATPQQDGADIRLSTPNGRSLRYRGLVVRDARDRELEALLLAIPEGIRIAVDARDAAWPLTIDPVIDTDWFGARDTNSAYYGTALAVGSDVNGDGYDDVIVGSPHVDEYDDMVYAYHGSTTGPSRAADWAYASPDTSSKLGDKVAAAGDVNGDGYDEVIAGDYSADIASEKQGRAVLFHGSPTGLDPSATWTGEGGRKSEHYGDAVDGAGDVNGDGYDDVVVGAPGYDDGTSRGGQAFLYLGTAAGLPLSADWTADPSQSVGTLGSAVAGAGDVNGDGFDDIALGAPGSTNGENREGGVYVHLGASGGPSPAADWSLDADQNMALLGEGVARAGDTDGDGYGDLAVGVPGHESGQVGEGAVWLLRGSAAGLGSAPSWTLEGEEEGAELGRAIAPAGDVDNDGFDDLVIGAYEVNAAWVFHGSAAGLLGSASTTFEGVSGRVGEAVAGGGDVDGDGYDDVVVGGNEFAWLLSGGSSGANFDGNWAARIEADSWYLANLGDVNADGYDDLGSAGSGSPINVFLGSASGVPTTPTASLSASVGAGLDSAGDVDGDGFDDLVAGSSTSWGTGDYPGLVAVHYGSASGIDSARRSWIGTDQESASLGHAAAGAGDVDGDGFKDVIAGAPEYDSPEIGEGRAYVWRGTAAGLSIDAPLWSAEGNVTAARFGDAVEGDGDLDGDGYDDIVVGARSYTGSLSSEGASFAYFGSASGPSPSPDWQDLGAQSNAFCGYAVAILGDVNADGYHDLATGCPYYDDGHADEGVVRIFHGSPTGPGPVATQELQLDQDEAHLGDPLQRLGDVDGDGYDDLVTATWEYDYVHEDRGAALLYFGGATGIPGAPDYTFVVDSAHRGFGYSAAGLDADSDGQAELVVGLFDPDVIYIFAFDDDDGDGSPTWVDCDDTNALANPSGTEVCNGADDDCDGTIDPDDAADAATWYTDADGDGYGDAGTGIVACSGPAGSVADGSDCDDASASVNPGATEVWYDDIDQACDGGSDYDQDGDGVDQPADCDDLDSTVTECPSDSGGDSGEVDSATEPRRPRSADDGDPGCGCDAGGGGSAWLGLLGLLALRRR